MRFCLNCGQQQDKRFCCNGSLTVNLPVNVSINPRKLGIRSTEIKQDSVEAVTAFQCYHTVNDMKEITQYEFLGKLPNRFKMCAYGAAGSGKSTFSIGLANKIASERGRVLYLSTEEGELSPTMQNKLKMLRITSKDLLIMHSLDLEKVAKFIIQNNIPHLFIDSVSKAKFSNDDLNEMYDIIDGILYYVIYQQNTGIASGEIGLQYDCDIILNVEDGVAKTEKNRFHCLDEHEIF